jgi:hypothetical protein
MFWNVYIRARDKSTYEAVAPDLPECTVTSSTKSRALTDIHLLIESRIAEFLGRGAEVPESRQAKDIQQSVSVKGAEWFSIHINLAHLKAVAKHQGGRWN